MVVAADLVVVIDGSACSGGGLARPSARAEEEQVVADAPRLSARQPPGRRWPRRGKRWTPFRKGHVRTGLPNEGLRVLVEPGLVDEVAVAEVDDARAPRVQRSD